MSRTEHLMAVLEGAGHRRSAPSELWSRDLAGLVDDLENQARRVSRAESGKNLPR
jgi:hypothetical protein